MGSLLAGLLIGIPLGMFISSMTLNIKRDGCTSLNEKLTKQGEKLDKEYEDRPNARKRYERKAIIIGALVFVYGMISVLCVIQVIGEWRT